MANRRPPHDPHADREAQKYDNPIPSREFIIELLEEAGEPLSRNQLTKMLDLETDDQLEALRRRLKAMERDGQLMLNRKRAYCLIDKMDLVRGRVQAHRDGFGFVVPDAGGEDYYLSSRQMSTVFDGDIVLCRGGGFDRRGKLEGVIVEVLERNTQQIVGRFANENGVMFVTPDNARINHDIFVIANDERPDLQPKVGQYVVVDIVSQPGWRTRPTGKIVEIMGDHMAAGMEIDVAIRTYDIPHVWPQEVIDEAANLADEPIESDKLGRIDLRKLPFVTIDGEDARDFDDAVYCQPEPSGGWRLWVAIADVSHYVGVDSPLDREAIVRGTSVYFPERVVPMLPEALSNGLCSLMPKVDRLCMVCEMTISADGKPTGHYFYEGLIHSAARLTYNKVGAMLAPEHAQHDELCERYSELLPDIKQLHNLYHALRAARKERGAIDFETTETRIVFGANRKIEEIVPVIRNDAHKLIEECMLAANVATATFLEQHDVDCLFRVHEGPTEEKLANLREFLGEQGLDLPGGDKPSPEDYQQVLGQLEGRADAHLIQTMLLRSLRQAVYQPQNEGHFGLNYSGYAHFTSPIRRYPDLLVHRAIRYIVRNQPSSKHVKTAESVQPLPKAQIYPYDMAALLGFGEQCSLAERRADEATRDVVAWLKCEYLEDRVGEKFKGVVSAVTSFGLFVELVDIYVEGLVHVSGLTSDYYHFDQAKQRLVGERTRTTFQLGDEVDVTVIRVSLDDKKIDLELAGVATGSNRRKRKDSKSFDDKKDASPRKRPAKKKAARDDKAASGNRPGKKSSSKPKAKAKKGGKKSTKAKSGNNSANNAGNNTARHVEQSSVSPATSKNNVAAKKSSMKKMTDAAKKIGKRWFGSKD